MSKKFQVHQIRGQIQYDEYEFEPPRDGRKDNKRVRREDKRSARELPCERDWG